MKKKINKPPQQFPNIFRFIPESKIVKKITIYKHFFRIVSIISLVISGILLVLIIILMFYSFLSFNKLSALNNKRQQLLSDLNFWQSVSSQYEGNKDVYFQIAALEYKLGDLDKSKIYVNKALLLDPNFDEAKKLQKLLNEKIN